MRQITGSGVSGLNSSEFASGHPHTFRANSMIAHCRPRQIPKKGNPFSRAHSTAVSIPSMPRSPKPPGINNPSNPSNWCSTPPDSYLSEDTQSTSTFTSLAMPPWISPCCTDL